MGAGCLGKTCIVTAAVYHVTFGDDLHSGNVYLRNIWSIKELFIFFSGSFTSIEDNVT